ncbi:MAG: VIT domain-containing protein, partial [Candidatus Aminicenantales bacterium]
MENQPRIKALVFVFFLAFLSLATGDMFADGFIIPVPRPGEKVPPLTVKYHRVDVEISNQVAHTSIDQVFINNHQKDIEGIYIFPIPEKAALSGFSMYVGEKRIEGEIL